MRRLYLQVYLAFCGVLLLFALLSGVLFHLGAVQGDSRWFANLSEIAAELQPPPSAPRAQLQATLARLGAGADVVSEGEMRRALAAGVMPEKIVFAGVGKSKQKVKKLKQIAGIERAEGGSFRAVRGRRRVSFAAAAAMAGPESRRDGSTRMSISMPMSRAWLSAMNR